MICDCYRMHGNKSVCYGTKEMEECSCGGMKRKCNFYAEYRNAPMNDSEKLAELISQIQYMGGLESRVAEHLIANGVTAQKHGRWKNVKETEVYSPDHRCTFTHTAETCSVCNVRVGFIGAKFYLYDAYCPNCGAKMDGESR